MPRQARESSGTGIYHVMMMALSHEPDGTPGGRNYGITDMTQEERWLAKYNEVMEEYKRKNQYE
ncbi:hypothetical protein M1D30_04160 [Prevotella sp. E15-22]|uniref:hypothetical protein n=1 Tax=Prevotella sp. E15-22 TaxID=2937774 RepID=UPI002047A69E|nr:hypothetical protein [Prevotella sp. E15-22]UPS45376.1 hypothetical protein M1D30_04160 [Prevotella sp. E15-22]